MKVLLVTIAIGEKYIQEYNRLFRPSQEAYARRCGYDFKVLTDYIDTRLRIPDLISLNKILVCSPPWAANYDFVIFVDADVIISKHAPPIHLATDFGDSIGVIDEYSQPSLSERLLFQQRMGWEPNASAYYKLCGFEINTDMVFNTGVLVLQPRKHRGFLESIYKKNAIFAVGHPRRFHYEQSCIGYEIQTTGNYVLLPNKYNAIWGLYKSCRENEHVGLQDFVNNNYFIHLAGRCDIDKVSSLDN
jgi:hypothetical protein